MGSGFIPAFVLEDPGLRNIRDDDVGEMATRPLAEAEGRIKLIVRGDRIRIPVEVVDEGRRVELGERPGGVVALGIHFNPMVSGLPDHDEGVLDFALVPLVRINRVVTAEQRRDPLEVHGATCAEISKFCNENK